MFIVLFKENEGLEIFFYYVLWFFSLILSLKVRYNRKFLFDA